MSDMFMVVVIAKGKVQLFHCQEKKNVAVRREHVKIIAIGRSHPPISNKTNSFFYLPFCFLKPPAVERKFERPEKMIVSQWGFSFPCKNTAHFK